MYTVTRTDLCIEKRIVKVVMKIYEGTMMAV